MAFKFSVKGQSGEIPHFGLGTATLFDSEVTAAVRAAIKLGYRAFDTALLYNNQEAVGAGINAAIAAGDCSREDLFITTKVGFYPVQADGTNCFSPIAFHPSNRKGYDTTREAIDLCLAKLQLTYVDLLLIHNPLTDLVEYNASAVPHAFELSKSILTNEERELIFAFRLSKVKYDEAAGEAVRAATWKALEEAHTAGKTRFIGVSNYTTRQCAAMAAYATVMPAVNQLELHPRASSPALRAAATAEGMVIIAYGSCNSVALEKSPVVAAIATRRGVSPLAVVLRWTLHKGVVIIPRTANVKHMEDNMKVAMGGEPLCEADVAALDALNEAHFYYWLPAASLPPGSKADL